MSWGERKRMTEHGVLELRLEDLEFYRKTGQTPSHKGNIIRAEDTEAQRLQ